MIWQGLCHTKLFYFVILTCHTETLHSKVKYLKILVILSLWRSIHKFQSLSKILWIFRLRLNMTNDSKEIFRLFCKRLKMTKKIKLKLTARWLLMKNKLTAKKVLSPKSLWNLAKKQKPSFMAFCVSKFLRARASGANKFRGFLWIYVKFSPKTQKFTFLG